MIRKKVIISDESIFNVNSHPEKIVLEDTSMRNIAANVYLEQLGTL